MRKALVILGELSDGDMDWIAQAGRCCVVPPGTPIIVEQQAVDTLFVILDGVATVTVRGVEVVRLAVARYWGKCRCWKRDFPPRP